MLRNIGAVIGGLIVGMMVNMALIQVNVAIFPLPDGMSMSDSAAMKAAVAAMPAAAWILVFVAHLGQAFVGGWVAARLAGSKPMLLALIVGALSLAGGIANLLMLSAPVWTWLETPFYIVVAWLAGRLEVARRAGA